MATVCHPLHDLAEVVDPNVVKVVLDKDGHALYFSRAPIPWARDAWAGGVAALPDGLPVHRHIGLYAYRTGFLKAYPNLERPAVEIFESLEQLRALWHGYRIAVLTIDAACRRVWIRRKIWRRCASCSIERCWGRESY